MNINELNEHQQQAVLCTDAPSLVIAGAGSGKTRVLTYKIAYLLEQGIKPWNILALTFTNKAAREMRERIGQLVDEAQAGALWMGTFHSIFGRILRREASLIGFDSNFTIYDASDAKNLITDIIREMGLNDKQYKAAIVASRISNAKNALMLPSQYQSDSEMRQRDGRDNLSYVGKIYEMYWHRCKQSNAMDFDDMLLYTWLLFRDHPEVAARYEQHFEHVLVDEYQDTNYAQHQIVWQLTSHRQRLTVVGDDAQSIYSFRGANIDNILHFRERYAQSQIFKLEQNYRSTQNIVGAAGSLIEHNRNQIKKNVFSCQQEGNRISVYATQSDIEEAIVVQREIRSLMRSEHLSANEIAILYRTNAQSRAMEEQLRKNNIPYRIWGGQSFYQRKEIKDVIAYFRTVVNLADEVAFRRIINYPTRGIGDQSQNKIAQDAQRRQCTQWEVVSGEIPLDVSSATRSKIARFVEMMTEFHKRAEEEDAYTLAMDIVSRSGLREELMKGSGPDDITRQQNVQELLDHLSAWVNDRREEDEGVLLHHYLEEVSLLTDMDDEGTQDKECVTLMTIHAAKGLEFDAVFVVGMEEMLFPSQLSIDSPRALEEERRLCYVAMTRARKHLVLTWARSRFRYGKTEMCMPSRFLSEINQRYLQQGGAATRRSIETSFQKASSTLSRSSAFSSTQSSTLSASSFSSRPAQTPTSSRRMVPLGTRPSALRSNASSLNITESKTSSGASLRVGQEVEHARFGRGTVQFLEGSGMDAKATILFQNGETRKLLLRFANLKLC